MPRCAARSARRPPAGLATSASMAEGCSALWGGSLRHCGVRLTLIPGDVALSADRGWRVALIVAELVNNAIRHAFCDGGGEVLVEVESDGPTIACRVCDDGQSSCSGDAL